MNEWGRWARVLPSPLVEHIATLGPLGFMTKAPGTIGSVAGMVLYVVFLWGADPLAHLIACALLAFVGIGICTEAERRMQKNDPPEVIYDEFVAMPLVYIGIPMGALSLDWLALLVGFILFRFFDIAKPLGISRLQNLPGGAGVMMDDLAAALASAVCLHLLVVLRVIV